MIYLLTILMIIPEQADHLNSMNDYLYETINGLAGSSWIFDNLVALALDSTLVKSALIGACFIFAWLSGKDEAEIAHRRKILLITLFSAVLVIAATKTLSKTVFLPRPFIQSQKVFHLQNEQLVESPQLKYQVPLDPENQKTYKALQRGEILQNDLGSFPSDHAGFYMTIAFGILLACRSAGLVALAWTLLITLGSRVITGQHSPLDIAVGSGIGFGILLFSQAAFGSFGKRLLDPLVNWTLRHSALATAIIFIFVYEMTNTLVDVRQVSKTGMGIVKHLIGG